MIILLTNDDGIDSEGLKALQSSLCPLGDLWTVAPAHPQSAMGRAISIHRPLKVSEHGSRQYALEGTPSDCTNIALNRILPCMPSLVVSGINIGPNMGDDISYSGTVAGAFEAAIRGIPSIAVSLDCRTGCRFQPAAAFTARLAAYCIERSLPDGTFLNVNVPDTRGRDIERYRITRQGKCIYDSSVTVSTGPDGTLFYTIGGTDVGFHSIPGTDAHAVSEKYISITPLSVDLTNHGVVGFFEHMKL